jgi:hypothetical protein
LHELGHNLGLHHGGLDDINFKPNYLSVMNYSYQFVGVPTGPASNPIDYSRFGQPILPVLNEASLDENTSLGASFRGPLDGILAYMPVCNAFAYGIAGAIDFNCDGNNAETGVQANLNPNDDSNSTDVLAPYEDWHSLQFKGGAIGGLGLSPLLPDATPNDEAPVDMLEAVADKIVPPPSVFTGGADSITQSTATVNGTANPNGKDSQFAFQYGTDNTYTQETQYAPVGSGTALVPACEALTGLQPNTTYHYRAVVLSDVHQLYGTDNTFTTALRAPFHRPRPSRRWRGR